LINLFITCIQLLRRWNFCLYPAKVKEITNNGTRNYFGWPLLKKKTLLSSSLRWIQEHILPILNFRRKPQLCDSTLRNSNCTGPNFYILLSLFITKYSKQHFSSITVLNCVHICQRGRFLSISGAHRYELLYLRMNFCNCVWIFVTAYEFLYLGMNFVPGYEFLCLGMNICTWVWLLYVVKKLCIFYGV
jgi:hypothetical protein